MSESIDQHIGDYRLTRLLGQEGIVETYLGAHRHLNTPVIVKILSVQLTSEQEQIFRRKVRPMAELMHKHIVRLLDFTVLQGWPVLFQDYFPAGTLRKVHAYGSRTVFRQVLSYVERLAEALQYMHSRQVVHGDLRPENVMLGWESNIVLNDCGLAELIHTLVPDRIYPPTEATAYLAPERFQGRLLPASDQYALAVMAYEWLCGETPFQGSSSGTMTGEPPTPRAKTSALSPEVEQVIMTALAQDPARRFAHVQEFAAALEQAGRRSGVISAASLAPTMPTPSGRPLADGYALPAQRGGLSRRTLISMLALGGVGLAVVSSAATAVMLNVSGNQTAAGTQLVGKLLATCPRTGNVEYLSWSPDGKSLATAGTGVDGIQIWDAATGKLTTTAPRPVASLRSPHNNPCAWVGERLYAANIDATDKKNPVIRVRDLIGKKDVLVYQGYASGKSAATQENGPEVLAWSPNGQMIASLSYETGIRVWDAKTGQDISTFQVQAGDHGIPDGAVLRQTSLSWAPDSRHIATWGGTGIIYIWDVSNGKLISSYSKHWEQHRNDGQFVTVTPDMEWSPDSTRIVSSVATDETLNSRDGVIHVWDVRGGRDICAFNKSQPNSETTDMGWSADSKLIACVMKGNAVVWDAGSGTIVTTRYTQGGDDNIAWHPQRRYLASTMKSTTDTDGGGKGYIWDAMTGKEILRLNSKTENVLAWSPDGMRLALGTLDTVEIWQIWA